MLLALLAIITILVDNTPPVINILAPNNTILNTSIIKTKIYDNLGIKECYYVLNNQKIKFDCNEIKLSPGCYNLTIGAIDLVNNENRVLFSTCIDLEPPKIINYGFYPPNNSIYQNTTYKFWIKVSDDLKIKKIVLKFNGRTYTFEPKQYVEFNTTNVKIGENYLEWEVCDISGKCSNLKIVYYVRSPIKQVLKLNLRDEIFLGECQRIEYETNVNSVNLTIIHNGKNITVALPGKGNYTYCPNETGLYIVDLLGLKKKFIVIYALNSTIEVVRLNRSVKSSVEAIYKNKILYKNVGLKHKIFLPENSKLYVKALNNSLIAYFIDITPKEQMIIEVDKKIKNDSIIYYIKPNFKFKKVILYLDKGNLTNIEVFKCENYDINKGCLSSWIKVPFSLEKNYVKIVQNTLSAFMIKQKECKVEIISPDLIITQVNKTKCFYVSIKADYCPRYSLKIEGNYTNVTKINDVYKICIVYNEIGTYWLKIIYGSFEKFVEVKVVKEPKPEEPYIIVYPNKIIVKTYEKDKLVTRNLLIKNIGEKAIHINIYSEKLKINKTILLNPSSTYNLTFKLKAGNYFAKIIINYSKGKIVVPVKVIYIPDWVNISIKLLNKEAPYLVKIEIWSKRDLNNVKLCYGIKNEFSRCELVNLTSYQYFTKILKPKKAGEKVIFARIGDKESTIKVEYEKPTIGISVKEIGMILLVSVAAVVISKMILR